MYKRTTSRTNHSHLLFTSTTMTTPSPLTTTTPSPMITVVEITTVEIIEEALSNHLNLRMPPPSPQLTIPLPTFPLTIAIPSPQDLAVHIDSRDPSPFALRQPLPDDTLDSPINFNCMKEDKENKDPMTQDFLSSPTTRHRHDTIPSTSDSTTPPPMGQHESSPNIFSTARKGKKWWVVWERGNHGMATWSTWSHIPQPGWPSL